MQFYSRLLHVVPVIGAIVFSLPSNAAPEGTTTTATGCGLNYSSNYVPIGPTGVGIQDSCSVTASNGYVVYTAVSNVLTTFGPAVPKVGLVDASASVAATGFDSSAPPGTDYGGVAQAQGSVVYYFTVDALSAPPITTFEPTVYVEASGAASIAVDSSDTASFEYEGSAGAFAILPDGTQWGIAREITDPQSSWSDEFSESKILDLAPNDAGNPFYTVTIAAGCDVGAWAGGEYFSTAECTAIVDPVIYLDQAAFDAKYGEDSFQLADYYGLSFSSNVGAIPVPAAVWLFGSALLGLAGLAGLRRR